MGGLLIVLTTFLPVFDSWSISAQKKRLGSQKSTATDLHAGGRIPEISRITSRTGART